MSRRGSGGLVEAVLGIGAKVPWPAAAALAVVFFGIFRWLSNIDAPDPAATTIATIAPVLPRTVVRTVAALLQYVVPALLLVGAAISAFAHQRRRALHSSVVAGGGNAIRDLSWPNFERFIGAYFEEHGFAVEVTGSSGPDGGIDLKLRRGKDSYLVQCKHWRARQVGVAIVRELYGVMAGAGAVGGFVVTSGSFSKEARNFAEGREIELIDGRMLEASTRAAGGRARAAVASPETRAAPACPECGSSMSMRVARRGRKVGQRFWGCSRYPACKGTREG
jgi:restriction system protein